jgi:hypothetical protein
MGAETVLDVKPLDGGRVEVMIPFDSHTVDEQGNSKPTSPGIKGQLRFVVSEWNAGADD